MISLLDTESLSQEPSVEVMLRMTYVWHQTFPDAPVQKLHVTFFGDKVKIEGAEGGIELKVSDFQ